MHAKGKAENADVSAASYDMTDDSNTDVSPNDAAIARIVQIRNAYVRTYNKRNPTAEPLKPLTKDSAAAMAIPQNASIMFEGKAMNTSSVLNVSIDTNDGKFPSAAINSGMSTAILALMTNANQIPKSEGGAKSGGYIQYDLFAKYFHKGDDDYAPGQDAGYYLGDTKRDLGLKTRGGLETIKKSIAARYKSIASGKKSGDDNANPLSKMARRIELAYGDNPPTTFQLIGQMRGGKSGESKIRSFVERKGNEPYGITNFAATQLAFLYKIPKEYLSDETVATLDDELFKRVKAVQTYLSTINLAYTTYRTEARKKGGAGTPSRAAPSPKKARSSSASPVSAGGAVSSSKSATKSSSKSKSKKSTPSAAEDED